MENLQADIIFYSSPAGNVKVEVIFNDETFWLNQKRLAELFGVDVRGYRVNSFQATQFRIWATKTLKEFIIKGFVLKKWKLV